MFSWTQPPIRVSKPLHPSVRCPWWRILAFAALTIALLYGLGWIFDFAARQDLRNKAHWILAKHGGNYDYAVLGPSRPYVGVDIGELQKQLGGRGINLALDGAGYPEQLLALRMFLRTNTVRHLLFDVNIAGLDPASFTYPFHDYDYLPYQRDPIIAAALREECGKKAWLWKNVPFWHNAEFNSMIGPVQAYTWAKAKFDPGARVAEFDEFGSRLAEHPFNQRGDLHPIRWRTEPHLIETVHEIIRTASADGCAITLTLTPEWQPYSLVQLNRQEILERYRQLAAGYGLQFLVFDNLPLVQDRSYFNDPSHLTAHGARIYTQALAARLKDKSP